MTRWTIEVDDDVAKRVAGVAAERGVAPERRSVPSYGE